MLANNITGEITHNGQLVVNIINRTDHMLWYYGQSNLCKLLQSMALIDTIPSPPSLSPDAEKSKTIKLTKRSLLNMTLDCVDMITKKNALGQGNWIVAIYTT